MATSKKKKVAAKKEKDGAPSPLKRKYLWPHKKKLGAEKKRKFHWRRWGLSLPGLCTLTLCLAPHRHQQKFSAYVSDSGGYIKY